MKTSEKIFTDLYVPQYRRLFGIAAAILGDTDDAADAVQETMVKIWNRRGTLAEIDNPEGYALRILRTTAIDMIRRRRDTESIDSARTADICADNDDGDAAGIIRKIIATLPPNQQTVVSLSLFDDAPPDEISRLTGFTPANVRQLLSRGRKKIKEMYQKIIEP